MTNAIGRPAVKAPKGCLTMADAAKRAGLSYSGLYRYIQSGEVSHTQDDQGVILIPATAIKELRDKIKSRAASLKKGRRAICVRVAPDEYERFEAAIAASHEDKKTEPPTVAEWLTELGLRAASRAGV